MRPKFLLSAALILMVAGLSFFAGTIWAEKEAQRVALVVIASETASHQATTFRFSRNALERLREQNVPDAQRLLVRLTKLQAQALADCSKSETCRRSLGNKMPNEAELAEVSNWDGNR